MNRDHLEKFVIDSLYNQYYVEATSNDEVSTDDNQYEIPDSNYKGTFDEWLNDPDKQDTVEWVIQWAESNYPN